jgi:hypothetical protein
LGTIVPGVGNAVGAGVGAVVGGAGGALSGAKAKREYRAAMRSSPGARRALIAELTVCLAIVAFSPLTDRRREDKPGTWMRRMTAILGLFFVLGLVSAAGAGGARIAAGLGGLVTVTLAISERDLFAKLAGLLSAKGVRTVSSGGQHNESPTAPTPVGGS